jgi:all-trans-retinol 13,14-reductase
MTTGKDVLIIGSGLGGLVCGAILAREGYQVTILESNRQIGGNLQVFSRKKHLFDSAVHYVGGLGPGQNLHKIFRYLGIMDQLSLEKLSEDAFDKIVFYDEPETEYPLAQDYDRFIANLAARFPGEEQALRKYCDLMMEICEKFPLYNIRNGDPNSKSEVLHHNAKECIAGFTSNRRLQQVLAGNNMLYAGVGDKSPFYLHALIQNSYIQGSYRFLKGSAQLAKLLARQIHAHGGRVITRSRVTRLHLNDKLVATAETTDGRHFTADHFISNAHPAQTLHMIDPVHLRPSYRKRIGSLENSISAFTVNIILKPERIPYQKSNYYCLLNNDVWDLLNYDERSWPTIFATFFSPHSGNPGYSRGITLLTYMKYSEVEPWKDTFNTVTNPGNRSSGYEQFKKERAKKLIAIAEKKFPGLTESIESYSVSTPLTLRDYLCTDDGSLYGITKDYRDSYRTMISPRTRIPNLFLTGQNINLHGVLGVAISSLVTCSAFIDLETLIRKINEAQNT